MISIHAPRTGSDAPGFVFRKSGGISIHAPRTGSDLAQGYQINPTTIFQSTLPARGATSSNVSRSPIFSYFNPRSPHGERLVCRDVTCDAKAISIHAPRTGSDGQPREPKGFKSNFNPRSPHGERLHLPLLAAAAGDISIHAPRTGSDYRATGTSRTAGNFNPRSPHGERRRETFPSAGVPRNFNPRSPHGERRGESPADRWRGQQFQSTLPARGATVRDIVLSHVLSISIHAPRTGSDPPPQRAEIILVDISIHAPRTGSDRTGFCCSLTSKISIHAPRTGSDARP